MRLVGYVRVSTAGQAEEGASLDAQRSKLGQYCELYGHELVGIEADEGASGSSMKKRDGLRAALEALEAGEVDGIIVAKLDRLTRSVRDLGALLDGPFDKGTLVSVSEQFDTSTAAGRLVLNVLMSVFQWEREAIAERTRDALSHLSERGVKLGGEALGWHRAEETDEAGRRLVRDVHGECETVRRILALRGEGLSLRAIATALTEEGRSTKRGGKWYASTVRAVLQRVAVVS